MSLTRSIRFALVGVLATSIDIAIAVGLTNAGLPRFLADPPALLAAAIVSLALHRRITLHGDTLDRWIRRRSVFTIVAVTAGVVDLLTFTVLTGIAVGPAKIIAIAVAAVVRAAAFRTVLFDVVRREQGVPTNRPAPPNGPRLSVVVPAYHEVERIGETVSQLRSALEPVLGAGQLELVIVDDGSGDGTADAARAAGADQVIALPENLGKGGAVRAGVLAATGRTVAFTDADLAYLPSQLLELLEPIERGWDVVIGNRQHALTRTVIGTSSVRSFGSRLVNGLTHLLLLGQYRDTQCGIKAFRSDVADALFEVGIINGFAFDIELLYLVEAYGFSLAEVPVEVRNSDTSTVNAVRDGLRVGRDIFRIRRRARHKEYPAVPVHPVPDSITPGHES